MSFSLHGISASKGIAIGRVSVLERSQFEVNEYVIEPGDIAREVERFNEAVRLAKTHVERLREQLPSALEEQAGAFIEVHMLMLQDAAIASAPAGLSKPTVAMLSGHSNCRGIRWLRPLMR